MGIAWKKCLNTDSEFCFPQRGMTALMKASSKGHKDVVHVLLEHGADVNITSTEVYIQ